MINAQTLSINTLQSLFITQVKPPQYIMIVGNKRIKLDAALMSNVCAFCVHWCLFATE